MLEIVFFDFDGTLTENDTFVSFAKFSVSPVRFYGAVVCALPWLVGWKLRVVSNSLAKRRLFSALFRGVGEAEFRRHCKGFADMVDRHLRDDMLLTLREHQRRGHHVCIVSASIGEWIRPWAVRHGICDVIATEAEIDVRTGCLTGRFATPNCHGEEKVRRVLERFPDLRDRETWAYGDSSADVPLLECVTHGCRV